MIDDQVWKDQMEFNATLRPLPDTYERRTTLTKEFTLHLISECAELLDASGTWKIHHKNTQLEDVSRIRSELIDIFKYWMSICQIWGQSPQDLLDAYWWKSAAVRQRWAEQWVRQLNRPFVILDLDNVLCDYVTGFCTWCGVHWPGTIHPDVLKRVQAQREWLSPITLGIDYRTWTMLKHEFRTSGEKRNLPMMPGAAEFVSWCKSKNYAVVVLTSRPIDQYPSLYVDTVNWFKSNQLDIDFIWWGSNKKDKLLEHEGMSDTLQHVVFVVDDDLDFIDQYSRLQLKTYWFHPVLSTYDMLTAPHRSMAVSSLKSIIEKEEAHVVR